MTYTFIRVSVGDFEANEMTKQDLQSDDGND